MRSAGLLTRLRNVGGMGPRSHRSKPGRRQQRASGWPLHRWLTVSALEVGLELGDLLATRTTSTIGILRTPRNQWWRCCIGATIETRIPMAGCRTTSNSISVRRGIRDGDFVADTVVPSGIEGALTAESTATQVTRGSNLTGRDEMESERSSARIGLSHAERWRLKTTSLRPNLRHDGHVVICDGNAQRPLITTRAAERLFLRWGTATESIVGAERLVHFLPTHMTAVRLIRYLLTSLTGHILMAVDLRRMQQAS